MLRELLNIKVALLILGSILLSSFITYSVVHQAESISCTALLNQKHTEDQAAKQFFKHRDRKIGDGARF